VPVAHFSLQQCDGKLHNGPEAPAVIFAKKPHQVIDIAHISKTIKNPVECAPLPLRPPV
jgi:hypothetical protein